MPKQNQKQKNKSGQKKNQIVDVRCYARLGRKSLLIDYNRTTYITALSLFEKLIDGTLTTQKGKKSKSLQLGIIDDGEITGDTNVFLTIKKKAVYFVPEENKVLVASVDSFRKLLSSDWSYIKLGMFK